jgi:hypothetical protein
MARPWSKPLLVVGASAAVVAGLILAGRWARDWLDRKGHFAVALADVECPVPPGLDRATFLSEVQFLGGLPDHLSAIDPTMVLRLASAFAGHPWVEEVHSVSLRGPDGPRADLTFRVPILALRGRAVDRHGVLLPATAPVNDLIAYRGPADLPKNPAGAPWGDANVESAARIANVLAPFQEKLRLTHVDTTRDGFVFIGRVTVRWGRDDENEAKVDRLREILAKAGAASTIDLTR